MIVNLASLIASRLQESGFAGGKKKKEVERGRVIYTFTAVFYFPFILSLLYAVTVINSLRNVFVDIMLLQ